MKMREMKIKNRREMKMRGKMKRKMKIKGKKDEKEDGDGDEDQQGKSGSPTWVSICWYMLETAATTTESQSPRPSSVL